jgi:hypothetical protein
MFKEVVDKEGCWMQASVFEKVVHKPRRREDADRMFQAIERIKASVIKNVLTVR